MYNPTDLRKETLIELDGVPYKVIEYAQKQMGRGGSICLLYTSDAADE